MPEVYAPDLPTFCDILRDYSRYGLLYFRGQESATQQKIREALRGSLEDNADRIERKLAATKKGDPASFGFLPMPKPGGNDFRAAFFLPHITSGLGANYTCSFALLFWIDRDMGKTVAIRIEPSGGVNNAHAYTHMQLTRTRGTV